MTKNLHVLPPVAPVNKAQQLERLEEIKALVESNELEALAIAGVHTDGSIATAWTTAPRYGLMIGAIAHLQQRYFARHDSHD